MTKNNKRLGRGLSALLGTEEGGFEAGSLEAAELIHLPVDQIDAEPLPAPPAPSTREEIAALADSLRQHGMLQPILVRPAGERFQVIAGERRLRAAVEAHLAEVPARVLELDDQRVNELAIVENLQRKDLNALEKAAGVPPLPRLLRRDPGGAGRPARDRPLDALEPAPTARPARGPPAGRRRASRSAPATPGPCWRSRTARSRRPPAGG